MESKTQLPPRTSPRRIRHFSRTLIISLAILFAIVVVGLAVGLGVGLSRNHNNNTDSKDNSNSTDMGAGSSLPSVYGLPFPGGYGSTPTPTVTPFANGMYQPPVGASWQIVLLQPLALDLSASSVEPNADVWDIDLFTNSDATISHLHALGKHVVCYFSAGSYEPGRPDSGQFNNNTDLGNELDGWPGEYWLNLNSQNVRNIMANRIKLAASKGCDAIDPDNVDGYSNNNGLNLQPSDSVSFVNFLSDTAAQYKMSTGLKNAQDIIPQVLHKTAFSVNEQCAQYSECSAFQPFIQAGKPVFHIEYPKGDSTNTQVAVSINIVNDVCQTSGKAAGSQKFSTVIKNMDLNGWVQYCNGNTAETPCAGSSKQHSSISVNLPNIDLPDIDLPDSGDDDDNDDDDDSDDGWPF